MQLEAFARGAMRWFDHRAVPRACSRNFVRLDPAKEAALVESVVANYYLAKGRGDPRVSPDLAADFEDAIYGTVVRNRKTAIPWLNSVAALDHMRILEIGTGTGGSIVPLAEQGAYVVGTDVDAVSLQVARDRCAVYGLDARIELHLLNAADLRGAFPAGSFDAAIFFASLEHMTLEERFAALPSAANLVRSGGWIAVIETPNRLWWYDGHTSDLPFYNWLAEEVALRYRAHSPRKELRELQAGEDDLVAFARMGRGVSYHEFQLALPEIDLGQVASCMRVWQRRVNPLRLVHWHASGNARFERLLRRNAPGIHTAFFQPYLDFVLPKA
jgi:ubiquinone/menaquinone biosynthesis C-methylase UbiE